MIRTTLGACVAIQVVVPVMRAQGWGRIVNISSNLAEDGLPGASVYAATKADLHALTRILAHKLVPAGILTNAVMPGLTLTERARRVLPANVLDRLARAAPTGRLTTPEDVAAVEVFLASVATDT